MFLQAILQEKANFLPNFHYLGFGIWVFGVYYLGLVFGFGFFGIWVNSSLKLTAIILKVDYRPDQDFFTPNFYFIFR